MKNEITIATNCYELDYKLVMSRMYGGGVLRIGDNRFSRRNLMISNVDCMDDVVKYYRKSDIYNDIDNIYSCKDFFDTVMANRNITVDSFKKKYSIKSRIKDSIKSLKIKPGMADGIKYSRAPMVAIDKCETEWLLYLTEDSYLVDCGNLDWIDSAIELMKSNDKFFVANPVPNCKVKQAIAASEGQEGDFIIGSGFSDQCFLINAYRFQKLVNLYNEQNDVTNKIYPSYAGNAFEVRVNAYMRNHGYKRLTNIKCTYRTNNITEDDIINAIL